MRFFKKHIYGILGGVLLYIPYLPFSFLLQLPDKPFNRLFGTCFLLETAVIIVTLIYKCNSARARLLRTSVMLLSFWLTIMLNGHIGTVRLLDEIFHVPETETMSRAVGLGYAFYHAVALWVCIITNVAMALFRAIIHRKRKTI